MTTFSFENKGTNKKTKENNATHAVASLFGMYFPVEYTRVRSANVNPDWPPPDPACPRTGIAKTVALTLPRASAVTSTDLLNVSQ